MFHGVRSARIFPATIGALSLLLVATACGGGLGTATIIERLE